MRELSIEKKVVKVDEVDAKIASAVDAVLRTAPGKVFWAYLHNLCGYNRSSLSRNPQSGEVNPLGTEAREAQRLIYINLRRLPTWELLRQAEELAEKPPVAKPDEKERKK